MPAVGVAPRFKVVRAILTRTGTTDVVVRINPTFKYFKCSGFKAKVTGSGATSKIGLVDANSDQFYLDAADKDYQTATINRLFTLDSTGTGGTGVTPTDATGAALTADVVAAAEPILEGPITVTWNDADGAAGTLALELKLEIAPPPGFRKRLVTLTRTATGNVLGTVGLGGATYFKCNGFRVQDTGPTNSILELKDADGIIFYLDAATKDYHTAEITRSFIQDDTRTGLTGLTLTDSTGAALAANSSIYARPILKGPIAVRWNNATDTASVMRLEVMVEV